mgnify:CR=1 FL=1
MKKWYAIKAENTQFQINENIESVTIVNAIQRFIKKHKEEIGIHAALNITAKKIDKPSH